MYSAIPIGGRTASEYVDRSQTVRNTPMGTDFDFDAEYASCWRVRAHRGPRGRHHPPAAGYGLA